MPKAKVHNVIEDLASLLTPLKSLKTDPKNAREHSERNISAVANSLNEFGQRKPIVVNKKNKVIEAGNGTFEAAKSLGWTHLAAVFGEDDEETAIGYALADNRTAELATWNDEILGELLQSISDNESVTIATGFTDDEIAELCSVATEDMTPSDDLVSQITAPESGSGEAPATPAEAGEGSGDSGDDYDDEDVSATHVRMVQLFFNSETIDPFMNKIMALRGKFETDNVTDTVAKAVEAQHEQEFGDD
jgi:hypothetical protein